MTTLTIDPDPPESLESPNPPKSPGSPTPPTPTEIDPSSGNPIYRFPPFPIPPQGITLIPFKDFKPSGIQNPPLGFPDGIERDGLGIPTCSLGSKVDDLEHVPGHSKKKKKKSRGKNRSAGGGGLTGVFVSGDGRRVPWWEEWAEGEEERGVRELDLDLPMRDRYSQAGNDFVSGRRMNAETQSIYDHFALFTGLLGRNLQAPLSRHAKELYKEQATAELDYDSEDNDLPDMSKVPVKPPSQAKRKTATVEDAKENSDSDAGADDEAGKGDSKKKSTIKGKGKEKAVTFDPPPTQEQDTLPKPFSEEIDAEDQEFFQKQLEEEEDAIADRTSSFLANPVFSMKVFLSSHFRDKGLIWSTVKLEQAPKVIEFLIQFLIRNKVLPEIQPKLMMALTIVEQAKVELPATALIGYSIPDPFAKVCTATWGPKQGLLDPIPVDWEKTLDEITAIKERNAKRVEENERRIEREKEKEKEREKEKMEEDVIELATESVVMDQAVEAVEQAVENETKPDNINGWGLNEEIDEHGELVGWGSAGGWGGGWGSGDDEANHNPWIQAEAEIAANWESDGVKASFISYFGPVPISRSFRHQYHPVIVEDSLRSVGKIYEPGFVFPEDQGKGVEGGEEDGEAGCWENERLSVVVLHPWDKPGESQLREAEVGEIPPEEEEEERRRKRPNEIPKDKDTRRQTIRALVPPNVAKVFVTGMVLGGVYVKIVETEPEEGKKPKEWWYIEKVVQTLPSYYEELNAGFINNLVTLA